MEFKNYKEKQAYYKNLANQYKMIWVSTPPNYKKGDIIKGRTYIKSHSDITGRGGMIYGNDSK